jgi:hypothetical protein
MEKEKSTHFILISVNNFSYIRKTRHIYVKGIFRPVSKVTLEVY